MRKKFEIIEHTADVGVRVYGENLKELFINAACGMFSLFDGLGKIKPEEKIEVRAKGIDAESLLINWLNELNYFITEKKMLFSRFEIKSFNCHCDSAMAGEAISDKFYLTAYSYGETVDFQKTHLPFEIKSATYHDLKIKKIKSGYTATIIFDV